MAKTKVDAMVDGGKASAGPPLGPALGPLKVNIGEIIQAINKKTEAFKGMKVPVKVIVDNETKEFSIDVGTPPVSQLIKKEIGIEKGSGAPNKLKVGNIAIEQAIKIAKMKYDAMLVNDLKSAVKNIVGSCHSLGVLVEGKQALEINKEIDEGKYNKEIKEESIMPSKEKLAELKAHLDVLQAEYKKELARIEAEAAAKQAEKKPAVEGGEGAKEAAPASGKPVPEKKESVEPAKPVKAGKK
ncbi:50S ribosomal protein L11 [archaeon]|nr:50S ribosomal protein L11 [archaeon]